MTNVGNIFKALADPTRRQIIEDLRGGEMAAGDIASGFKISGPSVSRHLSILKAAGLVAERREGNKVIYSLQEQELILSVGKFLSSVCPDQVVLRNRRKRGMNQ